MGALTKIWDGITPWRKKREWNGPPQGRDIDEVIDELIKTQEAVLGNTVLTIPGADTTGVQDSTNAINDAITSANDIGGVLEWPGGTLKISSPLNINTGSIWRGTGKRHFSVGKQTTIKAASNFVGAGLIDCSRNSDLTKGYGFSIRDLNLDGSSVTGVHGVYASNAFGGPTGFSLKNLATWNIGGNAIRLDAAWSFALSDLIFDNSLDHHLLLGNVGGTGITALLKNLYAKRTAANKAAYKVLAGRVKMDNCNGIDLPANTNSNWAHFGQSTLSGDAVNSDAYAYIVNSNIEAFTGVGAYFKFNSAADFYNVTVSPPGGSGVVANAIYDNNVAIKSEGNFIGSWGGTSRIYLPVGFNTGIGTGSWANGRPIHGGTMMPMDHSGLLTGWNYLGAYALDPGRITVNPGDSAIHISKLNTGRYASPKDTEYGRIHDKKTWDPPSVANGAFTTTTVPNVGAAVGMMAIASMANLPVGWRLEATILSADVVTVTLFNESGATGDLGSNVLHTLCFWYL